MPASVPMYFNVTWGAADGGSGLSHYDVQYSIGESDQWQGWLTNTLETSAPFLGEMEQTYYFKVIATDKVNNTDFEESGPVTVKGVTKYYTLGSQRVAMRQGDVVYYLHGDHLGSTSLTTDQANAIVSQARYLPYGQERWTSGATPTDFTFTGQRNEAGFGLMDYNARYYSQVSGRFISPDMVIPNPSAPISFNRYAYAHNNPVKYQDPSGHFIETVWDAANVVIGVGSLSYNLYQGNYTDAAIDAGGLVIDVAATLIPVVPGGAGAAIKAVRTAGKVDDLMDAAKTINGASNVVQGANQAEKVIDAGTTLKQTGAGDVGDIADELYDLIRNNPNDIEAIAKNTGYKPENIAKVKKHVFEEPHLLDRYVDYGIPAEFRQFDSSQEIAEAWKRLENGNFTPEDLDLLKHETAEAWYMRKHGPSYNDAHNAAQKSFPSPLE